MRVRMRMRMRMRMSMRMRTSTSTSESVCVRAKMQGNMCNRCLNIQDKYMRMLMCVLCAFSHIPRGLLSFRKRCDNCVRCPVALRF